MALGIYFKPASMNAAQYDDVIKRLDAAGASKPAGRRYHACFVSGDKLQVFDIWESQSAAPITRPLRDCPRHPVIVVTTSWMRQHGAVLQLQNQPVVDSS